MKKNNRSLEEIENYLQGKMTQEELIAFEAAMEEDSDLKEEVMLYEAIVNAADNDTWINFNGDKETLMKEASLFRSEETQEFSNLLHSFKEKNLKPETSKKSRFNFISIATIAVIFIGALFVFYPKEPNLNKLYNSHSNWSDLPSIITKGADTEKSFRELQYNFQSNEYEKVTVIADSLILDYPDQEALILLYSGVSFLEMNKYEEAIERFEVLETSNSLDFHKAFWYKALSFLKKGDKLNSIKELQVITKHPEYYKHNEAKKLLRKLD